jgi:solute carrier family 35 protein F5
MLSTFSCPHSNLSGTFTFAFSWYLGVDTFTYGKVFGILACFLGAVCVGLNDSKDSGGQESSSHGAEHSVGGDSVALLGAVFYGLYTTVIKYMVGFAWRMYLLCVRKSLPAVYVLV